MRGQHITRRGVIQLGAAATIGLAAPQYRFALAGNPKITFWNPGIFPTEDPNDKTKIVSTFEGIADGLVTAFGSESTTTRTEVQGVGRAAFVFDSSRGTLHSVRGEAGQFGLVIQSSPELDYQSPTNTFVGGEEHVLTDSELPVPSAPAIPTE